MEEPTTEQESSSILAPKPKRKMTEKQLENLKKGQEVRTANRLKRAEEKKQLVDELVNKKIEKKEKEKKQLQTVLGLTDDDDEPAPPKDPPKLKKTKKKVVYLPPSDDSESEEEQIIYKKSSRKPRIEIAEEIADELPERPSHRIVFY